MPRHSPPRSRFAARRRGVTLIELVVSLSVGSLVLLGAHALVVQLTDAERTIEGAAARNDREANRERLLRALVGSLEQGVHEQHWLSGDMRRARFRSWCRVAAGWSEPCAIELVVRDDGRTSSLEALIETSAGTERIALRQDATVALLYLERASEGGLWSRGWPSQVTPPLAIGVVGAGDTLIVRIGERG